MSLFRVYVDGALFYHPQMSKLAITDARIEEDAENIDCGTGDGSLSRPPVPALSNEKAAVAHQHLAGGVAGFVGQKADGARDLLRAAEPLHRDHVPG